MITFQLKLAFSIIIFIFLLGGYGEGCLMEIEDRVGNRNILLHLPYWPACQILPEIGDLQSSAGEIMNICV